MSFPLSSRYKGATCTSYSRIHSRKSEMADVHKPVLSFQYKNIPLTKFPAGVKSSSWTTKSFEEIILSAAPQKVPCQISATGVDCVFAEDSSESELEAYLLYITKRIHISSPMYFSYYGKY